MSSRFASERLASLRRNAQRSIEQAEEQEDHALALLAVDDANAARQSPARLLIIHLVAGAGPSEVSLT